MSFDFLFDTIALIAVCQISAFLFFLCILQHIKFAFSSARLCAISLCLNVFPNGAHISGLFSYACLDLR